MPADQTFAAHLWLLVTCLSTPSQYCRNAIYLEGILSVTRGYQGYQDKYVRANAGERAKKSATPRGCAKVPPKEEVLEDMPILVRAPSTIRIMPKGKTICKRFLLLCNIYFIS